MQILKKVQYHYPLLKKDNKGKRSKLSQKDTDASWMTKGGERHFGYKDHVNVSNKTKLITKYSVSGASPHDSTELENLIDETDHQLHADSAYRSEKIEKYLQDKEYKSFIHKKGYTAKLNLTYTKVYAEVDGYVSNINFQIGSQAVANQPILALVDVNSYWVFGFFREDAIPNVHVGDKAKVTLLAYPDIVLSGKVESIAWGISHSDGNPGNNLLPSVKPVFQWIRLAQRIPVRIKLDTLPENVKLRFGLTASVMVLNRKE